MLTTEPSFSYRRAPKQDRAQARIATIIGAAERLICEKGLEGATMTEIAQMANASIGALYQYFPNKALIVEAMRERYEREVEERWQDFQRRCKTSGLMQFAEQVVDFFAALVRDFPAYRQLCLPSPAGAGGSEEGARLSLRLSSLIAQLAKDLPEVRVRRIAQALLAIIHSLLGALESPDLRERDDMRDEMTCALRAYLSQCSA